MDVESIIKAHYKRIGSLGGLKHDAKKSTETKLAKYGPDYFKTISRSRKSYKEKQS